MIDNELVKWLDSHTNFETGKLSRRATMPTLERIELLLHYLGDPQDQIKSIHVTGTNGKTSTVRITDALLREKGLRVGSITSPHLFEINERLFIDGKPVNSEELNSALWIMKNAQDSIEAIANNAPTWFELVVAGSLYVMQDEAIDVGVVEVGMGGKFDATNVINSEVSVVTNVDLDHMSYLGDTKEKIAIEKSGIIKESSTAVIGEAEQSLAKIFEEKAKSVNSKCLLINRDFEIHQNDQAVGGRLLSFSTPYARYQEVFMPLFGYHQGLNAVIATVAAEAFIGAELGEEIVTQGLSNISNAGRLEIVSHEPLIILDGAHNVSGAQSLATALQDEFPTGSKIFVVGFTEEKDPEAMLNALNIDNEDIVIATQADYPRAMEASTISETANRLGVENVITCQEIKSAINNAISIALDDTQVIVTGSLYLVGQARNLVSQL